MNKTERDRLFKLTLEGETVELKLDRAMFKGMSKKRAKKEAKKIMRIYWKDAKRQERKTRCFNANGKTRCHGKCSECTKKRDGVPYSLDKMEESGTLPEDIFSLEAYIEQKELCQVLYATIRTLEERDQEIIYLHFWEKYSERKIGKAINMSQSGVHYRKGKALKTLKTEIFKRFSGDF